MTENEAKSFIQGKLNCMNKCDVFDCKYTDECDSCKYCYSQGTFGEQNKAFDMAIKALEEVQQYRELGTVKGYERAIQSSIENYNLYREYKAKVQEFESIGTVEEFRELKEKDTPKKVTGYKYHNRDCTFYGHCPTCDAPVENGIGGADNVCKKCNQALDWGPGFKRLECE